MNYIYQVSAYKGTMFVLDETFESKEEADDFAFALKHRGLGIDKIVRETRTRITNLCYSKKVWLWQKCGRWDNGTFYLINEESKLALRGAR